MKELSLLEEKVGILIEKFLSQPYNFFHEKEIHSVFFNLCREQFGRANPNDEQIEIDLFRQEYDTIWLYRHPKKDELSSSEKFSKKYESSGTTRATTGVIDFVILNKDFVKNHTWLTGINKDEKGRKEIRCMDITNKPIIDIGIEFKMAHITKNKSISNSAIKNLEEGLLEDCRKLAQELIPYACVLGFSHGSLPALPETERLVTKCQQEYLKYNPKGKISIWMVTPQLIAEALWGGKVQTKILSANQPDFSQNDQQYQKMEKAWYYYKKDDKQYFLAFVNAKGSCSLSGFNVENGKYSFFRKSTNCNYQKGFNEYLRFSIPVKVSKQPNLVEARKQGLQEPQLSELKKSCK